MLARLCQLKSQLFFALLLVSGCSFFRNEKDVPRELMDSKPNQWFSKNPNHALWDQDGVPVTHHFFDFNPDLSKDDQFISMVVTIPEGSEHSYQLDLASGQRFYSHSYCPQNDIWRKYSGSIFKPKFTLGVIPRMLDQQGEPQKIVVFGGKKKFNETIYGVEFRVRLIGAYVEQSCLEGNCLGKSNWVSRLVFLAVDPQDRKFGAVTDIEGLRKETNWNEDKAILENIDGQNGSSSASFPSIRIGQLVAIEEAMDFHKKGSIFLSQTESQKVQQGCQLLYDRLWKEVGKEQPEDKAAKTVDELKAKLKIIEELKAKRLPVGFAARFKIFTKKYSSEMSTCEKFVYHGNLNKDPEQFWFLNYAGLFFRLHKDGYIFDCNKKSWQKNTLNTDGKPVYVLNRDIDRCQDKDFDMAMSYLPNYLTGLKSSEYTYYKFVDYDTHAFGTHQKIYSWVKVKTKKYDCSHDPNPDVRKELKVFPDDVTWKPRYVKDIADDMKLIY